MAIQTRPPEPQTTKSEIRINRVKRTVRNTMSGDPIGTFMWLILFLMIPFFLLDRHVAWELYFILGILVGVKMYLYVNRKRIGTDT